MTYYNVGKLLSEAGKHYGEGIIKEYSIKLTKELGKGYTETNLKYFRQFYNFAKSHTLCDELSWSHYRILLSISNYNSINYYVSVTKNRRLSVRKLQEIIKNNEYEKLPLETREKLINNEKEEIQDYIKHPIIINNPNNFTNISEKVLKQLILEDLDNFLKQLGQGYSYIESEYKIMIGNIPNYIDILLFNIKYNCYVVIELKITPVKKEHIGQIQIYMNYIDKHVKSINHNANDTKIYEAIFIK